MPDAILLSAEFMLYPKKATAQVVLTNTTLTVKNNLFKNKPDEVISLEDVIGCHVVEGNKTTGALWHLCVFSYPLQKKIFKGLTRLRLARSLGIACCNNNEENKTLAEKWKRVIKYLISGNTLTKDEVDTIHDVTPRKFIVYINPFSGRGKAMDIYQNHVKSVFAEAEIKHSVVKTEYGGHAQKLVKDIDIKKYDGIVIVSGDGLIHEVINGLMERHDWEEAIKIPIGVVPGGSGNALAASIVFASTGIHPLPSVLPSSIFEICRGTVTDLDILSVETPDGSEVGKTKITHSLLGTVIGLISDVDIESERLRFLGGALRSNIYAVMRIITLRNYKITLSYLPAERSKNDNLHEGGNGIELNDNTKSVGNSAANLASGDSSRTLSNDLLVPLHESVPETWNTVDGDYIQVSALNLSHLGEDVIMHRDLARCDGKIMLAAIKSTTNRRTMIKLWDNLEDGTGLVTSTSPSNIELFPCKAFRIVPHTKHSGIITCDGEVLEHGPFQCQIHSCLARVFGSKSQR